LNVKLQGEKHTTFDLITITHPFQKKFSIFKHVIQNELSHFPRHLRKIKAISVQQYSIYWKVDYQHRRTLWRLFFSKTVAAPSSKPFLVIDITEFSTEAERHTDVCGLKM